MPSLPPYSVWSHRPTLVQCGSGQHCGTTGCEYQDPGLVGGHPEDQPRERAWVPRGPRSPGPSHLPGCPISLFSTPLSPSKQWPSSLILVFCHVHRVTPAPGRHSQRQLSLQEELSVNLLRNGKFLSCSTIYKCIYVSIYLSSLDTKRDDFK